MRIAKESRKAGRKSSFSCAPAFIGAWWLICGTLCLSVAPVSVAAEKKWTVLENCQLVPHASNDGDSFHVRADGKDYVLRLYFVDAVETEASDPARLIDQAKHFGVEVPQVIQIGENAKKFVENQLAKPFTVQTRMANALGRSKMERFYAFVKTKDGDLGELLVRNGLARVLGRSSKTPEGVAGAAEKQRLEELESEAKQKRLGGWAGKITESTPASAPLSSPVDRPAKASSGKIDINTATKKELLEVPGIGAELAQRIIEARPFDSADDLKRVSGIGDKNYDKFRPYIR